MSAFGTAMLLCIAALAFAKPLSILFLGNSHTVSNDVPGLTKALLESDGSGRTVEYRTMAGAFLEDICAVPQNQAEALSGKYSVIVMQGAKISSSHRYNYPHAPAVELGKAARAKGIKVYLLAEWSRQGIDESDYTLSIYKQIAGGSGARIVPICRAWDEVLRQQPKLDLWQPDGNHAKPLGSYLAACCLYYGIASPRRHTSWRPAGVDARTSALLLTVARSSVAASK